MCRIAGLIAPDMPAEILRQKLALMCDVQKHGGPDDDGIFVDQSLGLAFGHRRLAIIDLSTNGHQPMSDTAGRAYITFNGEVYNYRELRDELKTSGAEFKSETDTEVIIQSYLQWGTASFSKLRGIFAFALFDKAKQTTYLVRDLKGVKPLYYNATNHSLAFASEVRAFNAAALGIDEDADWPVRFLAFGNIPEPFTTLQNVYSLPKGSYLSWNHKSSTYSISHYHISLISTLITGKTEAQTAINKTFSEAIKRQLIADAPIGVFLSGGIDSSLITLLANQHEHAQLNTVSIHFDEQAYDESKYQSFIQDQVEGKKFNHLVTRADFDKNFASVLQAMDMPTVDGINTWFISHLARKDGLKAVLSGIGSDELFGGYPSFKRIKYIGYLRSLPSVALNTIAASNNRFKKLTYLKYKHYLADYLFLRGIFSVEEIADLTGRDAREVAAILFDNVPDIRLGDYGAWQASWLEINVYMQNQLLRDTDVMGMSQGLEIRVPFLDEEFCNIADNIAAGIRFQQKQLLINSFPALLSEQIWNRPKMGFTFPLQQWLKQSAVTDKAAYQSNTGKEIRDQFINDRLHWSKAFALYQVRQYV